MINQEIEVIKRLSIWCYISTSLKSVKERMRELRPDLEALLPPKSQ